MPPPQITLFTLGSAFGMQSVSPFCFKLELLLKHLGLEYDLQIEPDPRKTPKGKLPYANINGEVLADSEVIIERLDQLTEGRVYAGLSARDCAHGLALTRLAEEHLYWSIVASRWLNDDWWPNVVQDFFHLVPPIVRNLVAALARREVKKTYHLQGLGRHNEAEQEGFIRRDLLSLQNAISSQGFLFGATPCVFDLAVTSVLTGIYYNRPATWLTRLAADFPDLEAYIERVQRTIGQHAVHGHVHEQTPASGTPSVAAQAEPA